jgi:predicted membrane protein
MYGVGASIAVGVIALPIMMALGVPPQVAAPAFTMSTVAAYCINLVNFNSMKPLFQSEYAPYFAQYATLGGLLLLATILMCVWHLRALGVRKYSAVTVERPPVRPRVAWYAYGAPLVPVVAVMGFHWPMIPAFLLGTAYALAATWRQRTAPAAVDLFHKAFYEAFPDISTIAALWIICGMLIFAGQLPQVQAVLKPVFAPILPSTRLGLLLFFGLLGPIGLYRGPFQPVGTGAALLAIFLSVGTFPGPLLYLFWLCVWTICGSLCPTVSWNIWAIGFTRLTHRQFIGPGLPWAWGSAVLGLVAAYFYTAHLLP